MTVISSLLQFQLQFQFLAKFIVIVFYNSLNVGIDCCTVHCGPACRSCVLLHSIVLLDCVLFQSCLCFVAFR